MRLSELVRDIKRESSKWLKKRGGNLVGFYWQRGYGAFGVSESNVTKVRAYIRQQDEHHRQVNFQEEYRSFLTRHGLAYDERYVWD